MRIFPFPPPRTLLEADPLELRDVGLSVNKIVALKAAARALEAGELDETTLDRLATPALLEALVAHKGIGPWTAAVIALRGFGRLDVFPMNDSGVAKSLRTLTGDPGVQAEPVLAALAPQQGMLYYHLLLGRLDGRRRRWTGREPPPPRRSERSGMNTPTAPASPSSARRPGRLRLRLASHAPLVQLRRLLRSRRTSTGARCGSSTTTPCRRGRASARTRTATWRS